MGKIDKAAHELMGFHPVNGTYERDYVASYHEDRLYSVRDLVNRTVTLVYAGNPYEAIDLVRSKRITMTGNSNTQIGYVKDLVIK